MMRRQLLNPRYFSRISSLYSKTCYDKCTSHICKQNCIQECNWQFSIVPWTGYHSVCRSVTSLYVQKNIYKNVCKLELLSSHDEYNSIQRRVKSKSLKDGKKKKMPKGTTKKKDDVEMVEMEDEDGDPNEKFRSQLERQCNSLKEQFASELSLRTNIRAFESLLISVDNKRVPLNQIGQVIKKSPQMIHIDLAATPQYVKEVFDALMNSGLNVTPQKEGTSLFINIPKVTREHRENLSKSAQQKFGHTKHKIHQLEHSQKKKIKDLKGISEDEVKRRYMEIKKIAEDYTKKANNILSVKQKELLREG